MQLEASRGAVQERANESKARCKTEEVSQTWPLPHKAYLVCAKFNFKSADDADDDKEKRK